MKKLYILSILISLYSICLGQIQFDQQFSIPQQISGAESVDLWLRDYDENGIEELYASYYDYYDFGNWYLVEYDQNGDSTSVFYQMTIESQQFSRCTSFKSGNTVYLAVVQKVLIDGDLSYQIMIYDLGSGILQDTAEFPIGWNSGIFGFFINTRYFRYINRNEAEYLYLGLEVLHEDLDFSSSDSKMHKYSFEDGDISFIEDIDDCGYRLYEPDGYDFFIAFGSNFSFGYPNTIYISKEINRVSLDNPAVVEEIMHISDHGYFNLTKLTNNDTNYQNYGMITWETLNYYMTCYSPALSDTTWQICDADLIDSQMKASTCVSTNQGNHFILYFYEDMNGQNMFDVRDRITGNLALRGETEIMPYKILKKSDEELLFLVKNDSLINFYTLGEEIQVDIHQDEIVNNSFNLTNYPNPFNPETTISFDLSEPALVELGIYNIKGQKLRILTNSYYNAGKHTIIWDGKNNCQQQCTSGVYLLKLQNGNKEQSKKVLMLK